MGLRISNDEMLCDLGRLRCRRALAVDETLLGMSML